MQIDEVSGEKNWSNVLTKPLGVTAFCNDRSRLGVKFTWTIRGGSIDYMVGCEDRAGERARRESEGKQRT